MKKFLKHNWFKLLLVIFIIMVIYLYIKNEGSNTTYRYENECREIALDFIEKNNRNVDAAQWTLVQNKFVSKDKSCYAELGYGAIGYIYNLTTNKQVALMPAPISGEDWNEYRIKLKQDFIELKERIFKN